MSTIEDTKILTKTISNEACDYRLVSYKIEGKWTKPILEFNDEASTDNAEWGQTELFEHFSHGDIAYMNKEFGMRFGIGCFDEELINSDDLVEFKGQA